MTMIIRSLTPAGLAWLWRGLMLAGVGRGIGQEGCTPCLAAVMGSIRVDGRTPLYLTRSLERFSALIWKPISLLFNGTRIGCCLVASIWGPIWPACLTSHYVSRCPRSGIDF